MVGVITNGDLSVQQATHLLAGAVTLTPRLQKVVHTKHGRVWGHFLTELDSYASSIGVGTGDWDADFCPTYRELLPIAAAENDIMFEDDDMQDAYRRVLSEA